MNGRKDERFPKEMRLRKRADYLRVQHTGVKVQSRGFIGLLVFGGHGPTRLGVTTTKRLGNAVARNRIKRLVREAFRRGTMNIPIETEIVIIAKHKATALSNEEIFHDLKQLSRQARRLGEKRHPCDE